MHDTQPSRKARSDKTKQNILSAAESIFSQLGLYGARIDEIASAACVNKRMIYEYFGNKEELYKTILDRVYRRLSEYEEEFFSCADITDVCTAIHSIVRLYFTFLSENPSYVRMLMWENLNMGQFFDSMNMSDSRNPIKNALHSILARGQSQGVFRESIDEKQFLMTLFACPFNYFSNQYTMRRIMGSELTDASEIEDRISFTSELLLAYLKK